MSARDWFRDRDGEEAAMDAGIERQEKREAATKIINDLSGGAKDTFAALFLHGPTWDGNVPSKNGRGELIDKGLALRVEGFAALTKEGLSMAVWADFSTWADKRMHKKQQGG